MAKPTTRKITLDLNVDFVQATSDEKLPAIVAYAYSQGGQLLAHTAVGAKGDARLSFVGTAEPTAMRVLIGPAPIGDERPALDELLRRGAIEQHLRLSDKEQLPALRFPLYPDVWRYWLLGFCLVKGTVLKRVVRNGAPMDFPVCHATVEIYEVDPFWIVLQKLPPEIIAHLRDILAGRRPPIPIPDPGPKLPEGVVGPRPGPGPDPLPPGFDLTRVSVHGVDPEAIQALHMASGNDTLRFAAISGSEQMFQRSLIDHAALIRPILCWLYPWFVTMQLIGSTSTDECGHFRRYIFKGFHNPDQPDLYFRVKQRLFGFFEVIIRAPTPIACHTWWDYPCGTEVTLYVTHPLAITCKPCPPIIAGNNWVLFMAIGNFPLSRIHGSGQSLVPSTDTTNLGLSDGGAPWGGTLRPRLEFDSSLRDSLGVKYYRLSWKRDSESTYRPLTATVNRHFAHMVGTDLVLDAYPLGPQTQGSEGNLFEIPPTLPPLGQWSIPDAVEDTTSGKFNTVTADGSAIMDGKVQIRVDLFDAAGAAVNIAALGIDYYVPTSTDLSGTVHTVKASTLGLVAGNSMIITLHANNESCTANIAPPTVASVSADDCCGTLAYHPGDSVTMNWEASHPHNFASYSFGVVRGARSVFGNGGAVGGGVFSASRTVAQLLNDNLPAGCVEGGCTIAGFSENLHVYAMAGDGWGRQSQYDADDVRAFVLKPA